MSKSEQVLILEPSTELRFKGPFVDVVTSNLKLTNPTSHRVCFKVKTTAPRRYCVRPNSGIVQPHKSVNVAVMLQPFDYDANDKNKHKFMVQTLIAPEGEISLEQVFKEADQNDLMDSKLRCVFELPLDTKGQQMNDIDAPPAAGQQIRPVSQPIVGEPPKPSSGEELERATDEIKRLREELSNMRRENLLLKEDEIRRRNLQSTTVTDKKLPSVAPAASSVISSQEQQPSFVMLYIVALVCVVLGYLLGKL